MKKPTYLYNFEVYLKNPETGETGWEIEMLTVPAESKAEAREKLKLHPDFDCVILFNYEIKNDVNAISIFKTAF